MIVPQRPNPQAEDFFVPDPEHPRSITVYALNENKRPVGFAAWPKVKKPKKRDRRVAGT